MRKSLLFGMALSCSAMGMFFTSCSNDEIENPQVNNENKQESAVISKNITISVASGESKNSRVSVQFPGLNQPINYKFQKGDKIMVYSPDLEQLAKDTPGFSDVQDSVSAERYSRDYLTCESVTEENGKQVATFSGSIRYTPNYLRNDSVAYYVFAGGKFDGLTITNNHTTEGNYHVFKPEVKLNSVYDELSADGATDYLLNHYVVDGNKSLTNLGDTKTFYEYGKLIVSAQAMSDEHLNPDGNLIVPQGRCTLNAITSFIGVGINKDVVNALVDNNYDRNLEFYIACDGDNDEHDEGFTKYPIIDLESGNAVETHSLGTNTDYYYNYGTLGWGGNLDTAKRYVFTVEQMNEMLSQGRNLILFPIYPGYYMDFRVQTYEEGWNTANLVNEYQYNPNSSRDIFYLKVANNNADAQNNNNKPAGDDASVYSCNSLLWTGFTKAE